MRLPKIQLELIEDRSPLPSGFLRLQRRLLRAVYPDGSRSEPFEYDSVDRAAVDAVVIVAHYRVSGQVHVYLRSCLRPPIVFRDPVRSPLQNECLDGGLWELPAGLVEPHEAADLVGVRECARRELEEELGFQVTPERIQPLGPSLYPLPGAIAERQFYFEVEVEPTVIRPPLLDGSPLEHGGVVTAVPLLEALRLCAQGGIEDSKTELGLRRLAERFR